MAAMLGRALPPVPGQRPTAQLNADVFLPTGIMISLQVDPKSTLSEIKDQVYREARKYPLFTLLKDQGFYNFQGEWLSFIKLEF